MFSNKITRAAAVRRSAWYGCKTWTAMAKEGRLLITSLCSRHSSMTYLIDSGLVDCKVFLCGLTRREDGSSRNRPRVVYHRVYFPIRRLIDYSCGSCAALTVLRLHNVDCHGKPVSRIITTANRRENRSIPWNEWKIPLHPVRIYEP